MKGISWKDHLRYWFDNFMSKGTVSLAVGLGLLSLFIVVIAGIILTLSGIAPTDKAPLSFYEAAWECLMHTLNTGEVSTDTGWSFRLVMFVVTLGGILITSSLIGIVTSGVQTKMLDLRNGRSRVIERGHTVILGWSPQVFTIISELVIAHANHRQSCLVILGEEDKIRMEEQIRERVGATGRTHIVCRTGNPTIATDLDIVSLQTARSIIILPSDQVDPDPQTTKVLLAITKNPHRPAHYHIVTWLRDPKYGQVASLIGKADVEIVLVGDLTAHIIARTCVQSGLSVVYTELLNFAGDEIYFHSEPSLTGKTFGEALLTYEDSTVIGLCSMGGTPRLNPPMETLIQVGDQLIVISEDDDMVRLSGLMDLPIDGTSIRDGQCSVPVPNRTLVLGWNQHAPSIIEHLDQCVAPGSGVTIVANCPHIEADMAQCSSKLTNQTITCLPGDTTDRRALEDLHVGAYQHIILLSCDETGPQQADARTLMTLLYLRDIADRAGFTFSIVSQMLDVLNVQLAQTTHADDFIVSDELVSLMLAQVSENKALNAVFHEILDPEHSQVHLRPAAGYIALGVPVSFYTVIEAGRRQGHVALGYRLWAQANDAARSYGVVLNPDKSKHVTFGAQDSIIVLAEN